MVVVVVVSIKHVHNININKLSLKKKKMPSSSLIVVSGNNKNGCLARVIVVIFIIMCFFFFLDVLMMMSKKMMRRICARILFRIYRPKLPFLRRRVMSITFFFITPPKGSRESQQSRCSIPARELNGFVGRANRGRCI